MDLLDILLLIIIVGGSLYIIYTLFYDPTRFNNYKKK